jgi:hypothetical protein
MSETGLSTPQAQALLQQHGPNVLQKAQHRALLLQFLVCFRNPLVLVLLAASALSALTGDATGALIIGVIVFLSVTLDFVQAHRAGKGADKLALQVALSPAPGKKAQHCTRLCLEAGPVQANNGPCPPLPVPSPCASCAARLAGHGHSNNQGELVRNTATKNHTSARTWCALRGWPSTQRPPMPTPRCASSPRSCGARSTMTTRWTWTS